MPSPVLPGQGQGPAQGQAQEPTSNPGGARKRKRKRDDPQNSYAYEENDMSPEEEAAASPPRALHPPHAPHPAHTTHTALTTHTPRHTPDACSLSSDVEQFEGKIVYNPDGSAYIIEESELSDDDNSLGALPRLLGDGCIVDGRGVPSDAPREFPQIASAVYVSRQQLYGALCAMGTQAARIPDPPAVHTYRVFSFRDKTRPAQLRDNYKARDCLSVPVKPILMCFVCKLSFGYAKSFIAHAQTDHGLALLESEKDVLARKNSSAIIQCVGKEKEPLVSFLEPSGPASPSSSSNPHSGSADVTEVPNSLMNKQTDSNASDSNNDNSLLDNGSCERQENNIDSGRSGSGGHSNIWGDPPMSLITVQNPQAINASVQSRGGSPNSPGTPAPPSMASLPSLQPPPAFLSGTTIGVCPEHLQGRPSAADCPKCEMILASSRMGGPLAGMHSRNSCKTLKCPKCNWHYKYQETLEIHMKEKHPEAETSCIYCIAGQPHPRLARGETYTCGYKPYRCEVCNYSTTTKGNLSIHMQSDKHLNNMQELQNGGGGSGSGSAGEPLAPQPPPHTPPGPHKPPPPPHHSPVTSHKPKPTFRCDVCNYETNVARNLRIHMTSEKHTHNMLVLQQNVKHMQTLSALQHQHAQHGQQQLEGLLHFHPGLLPADKPLPNAEAALADMAYNQALMIQLMTGGPLPGHGPPDLAPHLDLGLNPDTMEPPPEPADQDPDRIYTCCVCNLFSTDSLEALAQHLAQDRTKVREQEILALVAGHYVCKLCTYKTNLKANFQLHCKTDKHLQRLQHVNHVKEGGPRNEWKLKYASAAGGVQVRCNACDYYTNSAHKLQLHAAGSRHEAGALLLRLLRTAPIGTKSRCGLCGFVARSRLPLLQHARSLNHLQMEQIHQLQRRSEGKDMPADIGEVFQLMVQQDQSFGDSEQDNKEPIDQKPELTQEQQMMRFLEQQQLLHQQMQQQIHQQQLQQAQQQQQQQQQDQQRQSEENSSEQHSCPFCNFSSDSELRLQAHIVAQHGAPTPTPPSFLCPLCQDGFRDRPALERHVMQIHSVNSEGLQRLLMLVDQSHWLNSTRLVSPDSVASSKDSGQKNDSANLDEERETTSPHSEENVEYENERCTTCGKNFKNIDELCLHQNETGHLELKQTPQGPGYLCWKKGCNQYFNNAQALQMHFKEIHAKNSISNMSVSEKHVYKYRCNQCSLAFKTMEKLQLHSQYHLIRDATKCVLCGRSFRSILALHKHVETSHSELTEEEVATFKQSLMSNPLLLAGLQGQVLDSSTNELLKKESLKLTEEEMMELEESKDLNNLSNEDGNQNDGENSDDSIIYKDQQFLEDYLNSQAMAEDSYNDPNRKYKCHRCKVAFTRQSYLTSHNKTLLHRKGEKLTYPMEKYLDPNRPFKCDVCKESFTQKNILLVHYNSVSHLHKLKRAMQEQQNNNNVPPSSPGVGGTGLNTSNLALTPKSTSSEEDDKKRYKCNICKVAYTQGSTLDIHMRSVLHQTRASKLQDLAISGQIDLSKPLIEQPDIPKQDPAKIFQDMLSPKNTSPSSSSSGGARGGSPPGPGPPSPSPGPQGVACNRCHALFPTQDQLSAHQALYCFLGPAALAAAGLVNLDSNNETADDMVAKTNNQPKKTDSQIYKHLLESFGFDLVMQYNENHQRRQLKIQRENEEKENARVPTPPALPAPPEPEPEEEKPPEGELPEVAKSTCQHCNKEFSSVWVLKTHCEEVHKDKVPLEFLEQFAEQFKSEYEKKAVVVTAATSSTVTSSPRVSSPVGGGGGEVVSAVTSTPTPVAQPPPSSTPGPQGDQTPQPPAQQRASSEERVNEGNAMQLAQQMSEMQAALGVIQLQQQLGQLHPVVAQMISMGLPLGLNVGALAALNLQPPIVPLMMPPPPFDQMPPFPQQEGQQAAMLKQQHAMMQQHQQQANAAVANQKRARTRITDDQLKILRAHFDINNSPSEDAIHEMAAQSGLPPKVIKHWFRNTLFKERQRNKDSPYNFNNPPSTTLNLEEYEKTGEAKVTPLNSSTSSDEGKPPPEKVAKISPAPPPPTPPMSFPKHENQVKMEPHEDKDEEINKYNSYDNKHQEDKMFNFPLNIPPQSPVSSLAGSEHPPHNISRPSTPNHISLSSIIQSQLESIPASAIPQIPQLSGNHPSMLPPKLTPQNFASPNNLPPNVLPMTPNRSLSPGRGLNEFGLSGGNSNGSNSSGGSSGKRANRTRFTDYQIKVLQEFFENNAYPKDDDLEYLSKLLGLSPRVIVVWFQNARQKARKVYENQPAVEQPLPGIPDEPGANRFQRTPGLNYQCKKCQLVFQRYYELIRHQKTHCYKEEDAKRSAQAQAAAAQVAATLSSEDSNSSTTTSEQHHPQQIQHRDSQQSQHHSVPVSPIMSMPQQAITPTPSSSNYPLSPVTTPTPSERGSDRERDRERERDRDREQKEGTFQCDKCNLVFPRFELWREHQLVHIMNPNLFPSYPPDSPFGILQQHAQLQQLNASLGGNEQNNVQHPLMSMLNNQINKRKFEEYEVELDSGDQPKDKRLRTTILPEQLDYLYQKYQVESNPSRKMLENIAREVGLKKRVVQVWFQNTRARERKGQFRAHAQVINKRCPFCPALFKVKSALESHLTTKHADQCARGEINIDALPDEELSMESSPSFGSQQGDKTPGNFSQGGANMMPPLFPPFHPDMEKFIKQYNEESMKRYISELQAQAVAQQNGGDMKESSGGRPEGEIPLDLSKPVDLSRPMKVNMDHERGGCEPGPLTDLSERSLCDERSDSMSETTEFYDDESNPTSPSSTQSNQKNNSSNCNKRFRTQMSSLQVKIMKSLFGDYKTPTMAECEMLGREIGLPKRVVQVWFQNARAKEKKHKLSTQNPNSDSESRGPEDCKYCQFKYSHKYSVQDHVFTKGHIAAVRSSLEGNCNNGANNQREDTGGLALLMAARLGNLAGLGNLESRDEELLRRLCAPAQSPAPSTPTPRSMMPALPAYPANDIGSKNGSLVNSISTNGAGLVVETGNGTALLDLPGTSLDQVRHISADPGISTLRLPRASPAPPPARDVDLEVCFVCKHCKVAFVTDHSLLAHQRQTCYSGREQERGVIRVVQTVLECKSCANGEKFKTLQEFRKHSETEGHINNHGSQKPGLPPPESPLSHEMEDVVNQITLLAARAAQESPSTGTKDSNANIQREFCAPGPAKPRFPPPGELMPQQASAGH